ncbi:MAG: hypothetical protein FRX49_00173 [Trebouxia sp. A1-2]|nr:MAG: hypothetical protein FRX49_00173 [Trebouxia sp. A1-2]
MASLKIKLLPGIVFRWRRGGAEDGTNFNRGSTGYRSCNSHLVGLTWLLVSDKLATETDSKGLPTLSNAGPMAFASSPSKSNALAVRHQIPYKWLYPAASSLDNFFHLIQSSTPFFPVTTAHVGYQLGSDLAADPPTGLPAWPALRTLRLGITYKAATFDQDDVFVHKDSRSDSLVLLPVLDLLLEGLHAALDKVPAARPASSSSAGPDVMLAELVLPFTLPPGPAAPLLPMEALVAAAGGLPAGDRRGDAMAEAVALLGGPPVVACCTISSSFFFLLSSSLSVTLLSTDTLPALRPNATKTAKAASLMSGAASLADLAAAGSTLE